MSVDKQFISTTAGNWLGDSDVYVWSHVRGDRWVKKRARDLNVGEQVLYHKDYVKTSIEEVEPFLERSPRYAFARDELHEKNNKGKYVPKLRTLLIRGLNPASDQSLEDMILKHDGDFSSKEYAEMAQKVIDVIKSARLEPPSETTIRCWLKGEVITPQRPQNWIFYRALRQINPEFSDFDPDKREMGNKFHCDYVYTTVRQGIMRYLAQCKNKGKGPQLEVKKDPSLTERITLTPEIQSTMDFFLKDISDDFVAARITYTSHISKRGQINRIQKNNPDVNLSKGLVTDKPKIIPINEISFGQLTNEKYTLSECVENTVIDYAEKNLFDKFELLKIKEDDFYESYVLRSTLKDLLKTNIVKELNKEFKFEYPDDLSKLKIKALQRQNHSPDAILEKDKKICDTAEKLTKETLEAIFKGKIDFYYNLKNGTMLDLINNYIKLTKATPLKIYRYQQLCCRLGTLSLNFEKLPKIEVNEALKLQHYLSEKIKKELMEIKKEYPDFESEKTFLSTFIRMYRRDQFQAKNFSIFAKSIEEIIREENFKYFLDSKFKDADAERKLGLTPLTGLITRKETYTILGKYGLTCLMPFIEYNFLLEKEQQTPTPKESRKTADLSKVTKNLVGRATRRLKTIENIAANKVKKIKQRTQRAINHYKYHWQESSKRHSKLQDYVAEHPEIIEPGLKCIQKEYYFQTQHHADILYQDKNEVFMPAEVEIKAVGTVGEIGLEQVLAYKNEFAVENKLAVGNVRGMLIAEEICDETKKLCDQYNIEYKEVKIHNEK